MANFPPLKSRFLQVLDDSLRTFHFQGRFLDFGCGRADVANHLMKTYGMSGDLLEASEEARKSLGDQKNFKENRLFSDLSEVPENSYDLITAFDVLEHLSQPNKVLGQLNDRLKDGGMLALILPYRPITWGWDDNFYGHLRRWSLRGLVDSLEGSGYEILFLADPTFPVYSGLRKLMLRSYRTRAQDESAETQSLKSSYENSWGSVPRWAQWIPWNLLNQLSRLSQHIFRGDEIYALAIKSGRSMDCAVCDRGQVTYHHTIGRHILHRCRHCGSQRVAPGQATQHPDKLKPFAWARDLKSVRDILRYAPQARSLLHVGCGRGRLLQEMKSLGWEVEGLERRLVENTFDNLSITNSSLTEFETNRQFDLITIHGELEFLNDFSGAFDKLKQLLNSQGTLMIEMVDFSRITQKFLKSLNDSMNLLNANTVCDQLANRDIALYKRRKLPGGRLQLWFRRRD